jgi:hypothetical protein
MTIAPVREEEIFLEPRIVIYHKVISDHELSVVKRLATPRVSRAGLGCQKTASSAVSTGVFGDVDTAYFLAFFTSYTGCHKSPDVFLRGHISGPAVTTGMTMVAKDAPHL